MALEGRVAIVTGSGGGLGRSHVLYLARKDVRVVVNDLSQEAADRVAAEVTAAGGSALAIAGSVTDEKAMAALVARVVDEWSRVDILVNNAGILRDKIFHRMSWSDWSDVIMVHLHGSFSMSRACATHFREQNSGSMIHMTSTSGLIGNFGQANYMAAKMGIVGLSRGIALDMQRFNVRSNCVSPFAWSRLIGTIPDETPEEKARVERIKAMGPEKIAPIVAYLASDLAKDVTGQIFAARMNEIFLMSQSRPVRSVHSAEGWTPQTIANRAIPAMKSSFYPLDRSGDIFSWDPL